MPLKITDPVTQVASLNRWADWIEEQLKHNQKHIAATNNQVAVINKSSGAIELQVPDIFTPIDQTVNLPGPLVLDLAPELQNTVFAGPATSGSGVGGIDKSVSVNSVTTDPLIATLTPASFPEFAICSVADWSGAATLDGSWTQLSWGGSEIFGYKNVSSGNCVATMGTGNLPVGAIMTLFAQSGSGPTLVQNNDTGGSVPGTTFLTFSGAVTTGNTVIIQVHGNSGSGAIGPLLVTDNKGNTYTQTGALDETDSIGPGHRYYVSQWCCIGVTGGAGFTVSVTSTGGNLVNNILGIAEFSHVAKVVSTSVPTFRALVDADLPVVDIPHGGTGRTTLPAHAVLLGEGASTVGFAPPVIAGYVLTDNGIGVDPTFQAISAGGLTTATKINGTGISLDKQFYFNGVADVVSVWGVKINGVSG